METNHTIIYNILFLIYFLFFLILGNYDSIFPVIILSLGAIVCSTVLLCIIFDKLKL